jgi:hypothetical protein
MRPQPKTKRKRLSKRKWEAQRAALWNDCNHCRECGCYLQLEQAIPHHIKFRSQGGGDEKENVKIVCSICHAKLHGIKVR